MPPTLFPPSCTQLLGCRGHDEWGAFWASAMKRANVGVEHMAVKQGPTARSCILSCGGQRTMRTCMAGCPRLGPQELRQDHFEGAAWAFLSACGWRQGAWIVCRECVLRAALLCKARLNVTALPMHVAVIISSDRPWPTA